MHILVNALLVYGDYSGVQRVIINQLRAMLDIESGHRFTVLALQDAPIEDAIGQSRMPYTVMRAPMRSGERMKRIVWEQSSLPHMLEAEDIEVYYAPGYINCLRWNGPSVVYIHDTIALDHPQLCRVSNALNYHHLLPRSARRATRVAVPSKAVKYDVVRYCKASSERIHVVPHGVEVSVPAAEHITSLKMKLGLTGPYLVAVSTIEPKKNFANLIRWYTHWKRVGIPHDLVIIGKWGWRHEGVRLALAQSPYRESVHLPGYLPDHEVCAAIAGADLLLMPSYCEGFGLPALESMALGTPVAVSNRGALPEVVGDAGHVLPLDGLVWRAEIPTLLNHPERLDPLREAGIARAQHYTWEKAARSLLGLFDEAARDWGVPL